MLLDTKVGTLANLGVVLDQRPESARRSDSRVDHVHKVRLLSGRPFGAWAASLLGALNRAVSILAYLKGGTGQWRSDGLTGFFSSISLSLALRLVRGGMVGGIGGGLMGK